MNVNNAIIKIIDDKNLSYTAVAKLMGKNKGTDVSAMLFKSGSMTMKSILPFLEVLGYELVVQEKRSGERRDDSIVITYDENEPYYKRKNITRKPRTSKQIVKTIMEEQGKTNAGLASILGMTPQSLWDKLNNSSTKDMAVVTLCKILQALEYKLVVVPENKNVKSSFVVATNDNEEEE